MELTEKEVKQWLNRAYENERIINKDKEELKKLNDLIDTGFGIDYQKPNIQSSPKNEAFFENNVIKLIEARKSLEEIILKQYKIKNEIRRAIEKLDDPFERNVLILRHVYFTPWLKIEEDMCYSRSQCFKIYNKALKNIKKIVKNT